MTSYSNDSVTLIVEEKVENKKINIDSVNIVEKESILENIFNQLLQLDSKYLSCISGNSQISATELLHLIPIHRTKTSIIQFSSRPFVMRWPWCVNFV